MPLLLQKLQVRLIFEYVIENVTYKVESDEATGLREIIITESKDKTKIPSLHILDENGGIIRTYNLPVGGHVVVEDKQVDSPVIFWLRFHVQLVRQVISPVVFHV